jgi:hypothetical protein
MTRSLLILLSGVLLGGCALFPQPLPETQTEFVPSGEIQLRSNGAAFDAVRIRKPNGNLSKRTDGSWGGVLAGQAIDVSVTPKRVSGVNLTLVLEESSAEKGTVITGQFQGNILRFEFGPDQAVIRTATHSATLMRSGPGTYGGKGELELKGEASLAEPPWPQFALALLVAFTD